MLTAWMLAFAPGKPWTTPVAQDNRLNLYGFNLFRAFFELYEPNLDLPMVLLEQIDEKTPL